MLLHIVRRITPTLVTACGASVVASLPFAVSAATVQQEIDAANTAAVWLIDQQHSNGSWGNNTGDATAVSEVLNGLKVVGIEGAPFSLGVSWLLAAAPDEYEARARRLKALYLADSGLYAHNYQTQDLDYALLTDPETGSQYASRWAWGNKPGDYPTVIDSALVFDSLAACSNQYICTIASNIYGAYQRSDGGWPLGISGVITTGDTSGAEYVKTASVYNESNIIATSHAVIAMAVFAARFEAFTGYDALISNGADWLASQLESGGHFGDNTGVYEAAVAYRAFKLSGKTSEAALVKDYLLTQQLTNGSWQEDPFLTGLVLQAMEGASGQPDSDGDGLPDAVEQSLGTDPQVVDFRWSRNEIKTNLGAERVLLEVPVGQALNLQLSTEAELSSPSYTLAAGWLPAGVTMSSSGLVSGTPTEEGSFLITVAVEGSDGSQLNLVANLAVSADDSDTDRDGMPLSYERQYGFNSLDGNDAGQDADGDGISNLEEFTFGSDPLVFNTLAGFEYWQTDLGASVAGSVAIDTANTIYVATGNRLQVLDQQGRAVWHYDVASDLLAEPVITQTGTIYLADSAGTVYALDSAGQLLWQAALPAGVSQSFAIDAEDSLYVAGNNSFLYKLTSLGVVEWSYDAGGSISQAPVAANGGASYVVVADKLHRITVDGNTEWVFTAADLILSSPVIGVAGDIYLTTSAQQLQVVRLQGVGHWSVTFGSLANSPVVDAAGNAYVTTAAGMLYAIDATGNALWSSQKGASFTNTSPALGQDGSLYVAATDNSIYAYDTLGNPLWNFASSGVISDSPILAANGSLYVSAGGLIESVYTDTVVSTSAAWALDGSNPSRSNHQSDQDGDGLPDVYENQYALLDVAQADALADVDTDSLSNVEEYALSLNPESNDTDGDSVLDSVDLYPLDPTESIDSDSDGMGNTADTDDDNDGVLDADDAFPLDANESVDTDNDGIGNNADTDDDGDGVDDNSDLFPLDASEHTDTDGDGIGDNADTDADNDGVDDSSDAFPTDPAESLDTDNDGIGNNADTDDDNDGVIDSSDAFPLNKDEYLDTDNDGIGNNADTDDDNDGVPDVNDAFPLDPTDSLDTDGDGIGNSTDTDDDNDGVADSSDAFPLDASESVDTDNDGIGNNADADDDGDGVDDNTDSFPLDPAESVDTDNDGIGNNADTDDDNDGVADTSDLFPLDASETIDTDADGIGNNADTDDDGDGVNDAEDVFPLDSSETLDSDADGIGNNADTDDDNDGVADTSDAFPFDASEYLDTDSDGIGNNTDTDDDGDGVDDASDQFPLDASETIDSDNDGIGNNADTDDDNDGVTDISDAFPFDAAESIDTDSDGIGNNADTDDDNDGVQDSADAFPLDANETIDTDSDGIGNNADIDDDNDGVDDASDAFPLDASESADTDNDGIGNNADMDDDNDGVEDSADAFPLDASETIDTDNDGIGNNADTDDDNDGVNDGADEFPLDASETLDTDGDGFGNNADTDDDNDGVDDTSDAFPLDAAESIDTDNDGIGNNADVDDDNDGVADTSDAFPLNASESIDTDGDGIGNNADTDDDNDGVSDAVDAFPLNASETVDTDNDGIGNNLDNDDDNDGVEDAIDLFPLNPEESQDSDSDGIGDNADIDADNDGMTDDWEFLYGLNSLDSSDSILDNDGDLLTNLEEFNVGTNPLDVDSDGDSMDDAYELVFDLNPRDSSDAILDFDNDNFVNREEYSLSYDPASAEYLRYQYKLQVGAEDSISQLMMIEHLEGAYGLAISYDEKFLYVSGNKLISVFKRVIGGYEHIQSLSGLTEERIDIKLSKSGRYLYAADGGFLRAYSVEYETGRLRYSIGGGEGYIGTNYNADELLISGDGERAYIYRDAGGQVYTFELDDFTGKASLVDEAQYASKVCDAKRHMSISYDGELLAAIQSDNSIVFSRFNEVTEKLETIGSPDFGANSLNNYEESYVRLSPFTNELFLLTYNESSIPVFRVYRYSLISNQISFELLGETVEGSLDDEGRLVSGLSNVKSIAFSHEGKLIYLTSRKEECTSTATITSVGDPGKVSVYVKGNDNKLSFVEAIVNNATDYEGQILASIEDPETIVLGPGGANLYVASPQDGAVTVVSIGVSDADGDGVEDTLDEFPNDHAEVFDTDGDGLGNNIDLDDDGDGVVDLAEHYPLNADLDILIDTDEDGIANVFDEDDDGDGIPDADDNFPLIPDVVGGEGVLNISVERTAAGGARGWSDGIAPSVLSPTLNGDAGSPLEINGYRVHGFVGLDTPNFDFRYFRSRFGVWLLLEGNWSSSEPFDSIEFTSTITPVTTYRFDITDLSRRDYMSAENVTLFEWPLSNPAYELWDIGDVISITVE